MLRHLLLAFASLLLPLRAERPIPPLPAREAVIAQTREAVTVLNERYWSPSLRIWLDRTGDDVRGHYERRINPPWWSCANVVETLIDFMNVTGTAEYQPMLESLYEVHRDFNNKKPLIVAELKRRGQWSEEDERKFQRREAEAAKKAREPKPAGRASSKANYHTEFRNEYLDDSAWWGVAWLKMHDRTKAGKYLATARAIHAHMAHNWRPDKGGGILWCEDEDKQVPNSITNSLYIVLSARLYERTREKAYLEAAERTLAWFREKALYDGTAIVDKPGHQGDYWTYNQGAYLGALLAMHAATGKGEYLDEAAKAADTILAKSGVVLPSGVIFEKLGTNGWDPGMFKGVFARYLAQARDTFIATKRHPEIAERIDKVLQKSAASMLTFSKTAEGEYRIGWEEGAKDQTQNYNTQASALALLTATLKRVE